MFSVLFDKKIHFYVVLCYYLALILYFCKVDIANSDDYNYKYNK